jgi:hemerythrin superfamily protein
MDALTLLTADHNHVRGLFSRFKTAEESDDQPTMQAVATMIFTELEVHTTIEETVFYPEVRRADEEIDKLVAEGLEEHTVAKRLIAEAQQLDPSDEQWPAKVKVLIESVEHHAGEEEKEMFPKIRSAKITDLEVLGTQLEKRKRELGAPTSADVIDLTKSELEELAKEQDIPGRSSMSKEELAATVRPR